MRTRNTQTYSLILLIADAVTVFVSFTLSYILRVTLDPRPLVAQVYAREFASAALSIVPLWIIIFAILGLYTRRFYERSWQEVGKLFIGTVLGILVILGYSFVVNEPFFPARLVAVYALFGTFVLLVIERKALHGIRYLLIRQGYTLHRTLLIGSGDTARAIAAELEANQRSPYKIVAIAGPRKVGRVSSAHRYGSFRHAIDNLRRHKIDTIIQTDLFEDENKNRLILDAAQTYHIGYHFIPGAAEFYSGKNDVTVLFGYPMISVYQTPLIGWGAIVKFIFDLLATTLLLIVLSPIILLTMVAQKIFNPGPIFYKSQRLSKYSRGFTLYKFRSMRPEFGATDATQEFKAMGREDLAKEYERNRKVSHDPRITTFGKFLRLTSLDELPQLFNVIKGDLSLVGPRPILPQELKHTSNQAALLHSVKSGVTGLWQVSGRSNLSFSERIDLELFYAQNWSFWLDIKILFKTIIVVIRSAGAR